MHILHISAEAYPVAKVGGLADVAGALPKYLNIEGHDAKLVLPMHRTRFLNTHEWEVVHKGVTNMGDHYFEYTVIRESSGTLGYELYLVDIFGLLDREGIYGYEDDAYRFLAFQLSVVDWMSNWSYRPDVVHVHDHHTALIPFILQYCYRYGHLQKIPTILTIHNAQYQGWMNWNMATLLPPYDLWKRGMLEWEGQINPLACGIKCASRVTTVSWSYLEELKYNSNGLESLIQQEIAKCSGVLNGIDTMVWNPASDQYLKHSYNADKVTEGKAAAKRELCDVFGLDSNKPLFIFIGRLVADKAADLLPSIVGESFYHLGRKMSFLFLGSGDPQIEAQLNAMNVYAEQDYSCYIGYNEGLSHQLYAGADFLLMPSRVEPCGLNQMYALRYGTVPLVRKTGGLKDTIKDQEEEGGYGFLFEHASVPDVIHAISRALELYEDKDALHRCRKQMMNLDFSWQHSVRNYLYLYHSVQKS